MIFFYHYDIANVKGYNTAAANDNNIFKIDL